MKEKLRSGLSKVAALIIVCAIILTSAAGIYFARKGFRKGGISFGGAPKAPSGLSAKFVPGGVLLTWNESSKDIDGFEIERKEGNGEFEKIGKTGGTQFLDKNTFKWAVYYYRVRAFNKKGYSPYSETVKVTMNDSAVAPIETPKFPEESGLFEEISVNPQIPQYKLPLKPSEICNFTEFEKKIPLGKGALDALLKNGFVVIDTPKDIASTELPFYLEGNKTVSAKNDFYPFYFALRKKDVPVFVTTDTLLHYYHILFDVNLMNMEENIFYDYIWDISEKLLKESLYIYKNATSEDLKEAAKRNVAYLSVALELLKPKNGHFEEKGNYSGEKPKEYEFTVPDFVKPLADKELSLIEKHKGWANSPIFIYKEDYSQYVPRGHYAMSEKLRNYFKAMMWFGRMESLINGSDKIQKGKSACRTDGIISDYDAKIQTLQALLITYGFLADESIQKEWSVMYAVTSFMVGVSDDLGPSEYGKVLEEELGKNITPEKIAENLPKIREKLAEIPKSPKIYGGLGGCEMLVPCPPLTKTQLQNLKEQAEAFLNETKGFRLMGRRFVLDSYFFSRLVSPYSGVYTGKKPPLPVSETPFTFVWNDPYPKDIRPFTWVKTGSADGCDGREVRGFPRGLDVMALFGSERAKEILEKEGDASYSDYENVFDELRKTVDGMSKKDYLKNVYTAWLYTLKSLLSPFGKGYQTFMQTDSWQDKELNTALASWAELRHDTTLYTKQSYAMAEKGEGGPMKKMVCYGYVEPVPEFYSRLESLTKMTEEGLKKIIPEEDLDRAMVSYSLEDLESYVKELESISLRETENKKLQPYEYDYIKHFSDGLEDLLRHSLMGLNLDRKFFMTSVVSDVHTDGNTKMVLEEATGNLKTVIVAFKVPDGRIVLGAGPVMSYYEFKQPVSKRLTDDEWRTMLKGKHPHVPKWTESFYIGGGN